MGSRSEAVPSDLAMLVERDARERTGGAIAASYRAVPQSTDDVGWTDEATVEMIAREPW